MGLADRDYMQPHKRDAAGGRHPQKLWRRVAVISVLLFAVLFLAIWYMERPHFQRSLSAFSGAANELAFPPSGTAAYVDQGRPKRDALPFEITDQSRGKLNTVLRFRDPASAALMAELYLHAGQSGVVRLPPGSYRVHMMTGRYWRGPADHFGPAANTYNLGVIEVGGSTSGLEILPSSLVGNATPMSRTRF